MARTPSAKEINASLAGLALTGDMGLRYKAFINMFSRGEIRINGEKVAPESTSGTLIHHIGEGLALVDGGVNLYKINGDKTRLIETLKSAANKMRDPINTLEERVNEFWQAHPNPDAKVKSDITFSELRAFQEKLRPAISLIENAVRPTRMAGV